MFRSVPRPVGLGVVAVAVGLILTSGVAALAQPANPFAQPGADGTTGADPGTTPADGNAGNGVAPAPAGAPPAGGAAPAAPAPAADAAGNDGDAWPAKDGRMAPSPAVVGDNGFYRGNIPPTAPGQPVPGSSGYYLSTFSLVFMMLCFIGWVRSAGWAGADSNALQIRPSFWTPILIASGFVGMLLAIISPHWTLAYFLGIACWALPLGLYVRERNPRVPEAARVFTKDHILGILAGYGIGTAGPKEEFVPIAGAPIRFIGKSGGERGEVDRTSQVESSKGYLVAKQMIYDAIQKRGTDVHLEPKDDEFSIRVRIDGVMYTEDPIEKPLGEAILNIIKVLGGMDITERRRPQDGSFRAETEGREIDFRVATQGQRHGEKMSLRILDQSSSVASIKGLGLRRAVTEGLERTVELPHGMMLVCGPTGAGKSTTLYACLNSIDTDQRNVITVEDPVEYKIDGVNQIEINQKSGQTFAASLRSILRQDPDVVMIGEIRDKETGEIACQAANTGHLVFSTIHANDSFTALFRLMELGIQPYVVANSVSAILAQRLARRLDPEFREAYAPDRKSLAKLGIKLAESDVMYRAPTNGHAEDVIPYKGRIGVFEFLEISSKIQELIRDQASLTRIKEEARSTGMLTMREEGLRIVVKGKTSMEEMLRVVK